MAHEFIDYGNEGLNSLELKNILRNYGLHFYEHPLTQVYKEMDDNGAPGWIISDKPLSRDEVIAVVGDIEPRILEEVKEQYKYTENDGADYMGAMTGISSDGVPTSMNQGFR